MKKVSNKRKLILITVFCILLVIIGIIAWYFSHTKIAILDPKGPIALQEYHLIVIALLLSLIVVLPVFGLTIGFAWKYRETNTKAKYSPDLDGNKFAETAWWVIPSALIAVLAVITWRSSHQLDPYKPIYSSTHTTITIQVVALDWKWLFIYPKQNIATVNFFQIPTQTPVNFEITSDSVMNSFWVPQLGGQIYAMPGMSTQLNLLASSNGNYSGSSANISGEGFSGMTFIAKASSQNDFNNWVNTVKQSPYSLTLPTYKSLARPSQNNPVNYYSSAMPKLYNTVVYSYLLPNPTESSQGMQEMDMQ
jgi:cytochrome o ubiquinol oxidase subunit 2